MQTGSWVSLPPPGNLIFAAQRKIRPTPSHSPSNQDLPLNTELQ